MTLLLLITGCLVPKDAIGELARDSAPLIIWANDENEFESILVDYIHMFKHQSEDNSAIAMFSENKVSDITEFYTPIIIDNYSLMCVAISEYGFVYYYLPDNKSINEEKIFSNTFGIEIVIERRNMDVDDIVSYLGKIAEENNYLINEGFLFNGENHIYGQIGRTIFRITVPDDLNTYENLCNLALHLKQSAVIVNLETQFKDKN